MRRASVWILLGFVPVLVLGLIFPDRLLKSAPPSGRFISSPGADIVAFVQDECPHCAAFEAFTFEQNWPVEYHEIRSPESQALFKEVQEHAPTLQQGVPTIFINGHLLQGYDTDETTGAKLTELYDECRETDDCYPFEEFLASDDEVEVDTAAGGTCTENCEEDPSKYVLDLWIFGEVDLLRLSLPALAILLGFLDGFNPCAMWVLITLLSLLITTKSMKKILIVGGTFLFVSGAMYYLFIAAWLNVFLLVGYNVIVQKVIGAVAIGAGGWYLFEALGEDPTVCRVTSGQRRQKIIARMRNVIDIAAWPAMLLGVSILAISVNTIELVCTAGLPAVFTQILAFNNVPDLARYGYIGLFILMYMIDDSIIFLIAILTMRATGMTTKYRRFTLIFGGLLMYALGLLMIFAPELLSFG